jgi:hypothetical protein
MQKTCVIGPVARSLSTGRIAINPLLIVQPSNGNTKRAHSAMSINYQFDCDEAQRFISEPPSRVDLAITSGITLYRLAGVS